MKRRNFWTAETTTGHFSVDNSSRWDVKQRLANAAEGRGDDDEASLRKQNQPKPPMLRREEQKHTKCFSRLSQRKEPLRGLACVICWKQEAPWGSLENGWEYYARSTQRWSPLRCDGFTSHLFRSGGPSTFDGSHTYTYIPRWGWESLSILPKRERERDSVRLWSSSAEGNSRATTIPDWTETQMLWECGLLLIASLSLSHNGKASDFS